MKTAVLYLRVSTTSQVQTDYDPEGISIPSQRRACERKAEQIGATIVGEYVEPGRSGTTIEKRPAFQAMLERIKTARDADYVIVYNLSRLNRNRVDDAKVLMLMRALKVTLVSAQENIDETPAGQLMHGILAAFNEYRSNADGADIRYKMGQKARNGGTLTRAKIGYLNVRDQVDGREVRSVAVDPERGPLIRLAFERYATSEYTMAQLSQFLTEHGLRMRPQRNRPASPITPKHLARILRDRYYLGYVNYLGEEYPGRHEALVTPELFDRVQAVLDRRVPRAGQRERRHDHYLKSTLYCGVCHDRGVDSRMLLVRAQGRGGEYWYYVCAERNRQACEGKYLGVDDVEAAVVRHYASVRLPREVLDRIGTVLATTLAEEERSQHLLHAQLTTRLRELDTKEENLLDLLEGGDTAAAKVRSRLRAIEEERVRLREQLADMQPQLQAGADLLRAALALLDDPQTLYQGASVAVRRQLNQVFFQRLWIDTDGVTDDEPREPFDGLLHLRTASQQPKRRRTTAPARAKSARAGAPSRAVTCASLLDRIAHDEGSSKGAMVELRGLEPLTPTLPGRTSALLQAPCLLGYTHLPGIPGAVAYRSIPFRAVARRSILQISSNATGVEVHHPCPGRAGAGRREYHHSRELARIMLVMTAARDELHRLVEQLPEDQVSAALIEVQRLASATDTSPWPPAWFGAIKAGRPDTSERVDELLAEGFGR